MILRLRSSIVMNEENGLKRSTAMINLIWQRISWKNCSLDFVLNFLPIQATPKSRHLVL